MGCIDTNEYTYYQNYHEPCTKEELEQISIPHLPRCDGAVYVTGDGMYSLLKSGDLVLYKEIHDVANGIFWGEMYLLNTNISDKEYVTVKHVQESEIPGCVRLVSQNKHYPDKDVELSKIKTMALVKASIRSNTMGVRKFSTVI